MVNITLWLKALGHWLGEARHAWIGGFVVVFALGFVRLSGTSEPSIRLTGMALQLLGILTVVKGINDTRKLFGRPGIIAAASNWKRHFPIIHRPAITATANITLDPVTASGRAIAAYRANPNANVEERVETLEKNMARIDERIRQTQREMDQMKVGSQDALKREERTRISEDSEIRAKLEATETGGLNISLIGAVWLFVGVILSSSSVELAHIFH